ncbi:MAG: hypothetical protein NWQ54_15415 [Paraglaciecola sp.]|nr:hypothetical protein [Paraglaciecola sp.]
MSSNNVDDKQYFELLERIKYTKPQTLRKLMQTEGLFSGLAPALVQKLIREVDHLWIKCDRPIDLRYKEDGLVIDRFDLLGTTHFIDISSKRLLLDEIKRFDDTYTIGVYESVKSNFEKNKADLALSQRLNERDINLVRFNETEYRSEERMNLAISATLYCLPDADVAIDFVPRTKMLKDGLPVVTSNISHHGLKIKAPTKFKRGQLVIITFDDLEKELVFKQNMIIYKVMVCKPNPKSHLFDSMLKLENIEANDEFSHYVKNLIFSHKHKYKVDLDTIYTSAQGKGYEQYYIDLTDALVLFANEQNIITHVLSDIKRQSIQPFVFSETNFLCALLAKDKVIDYLIDHQHCYYFVVRLKQKQSQKVVFFSTIIKKEAEIYSLLQHFKGSVSARLFKLQMDDVETERALLNSTIPEEAQVNYGTQRIHRYSKKAEDIVSQFERLISLIPVSAKVLASLTFTDQPYKPRVEDVFKPHSSLASNIQTIMPETNDGRAEDRFYYQTSVTISYLKSSCNAITETISSLGLSCRIDGNTHFNVGTVITVSFDEFAERNTKYALRLCKYTVVGFKDGVVRASNQAFSNHDGRTFWLAFILDKLDQLKVQGRDQQAYGLSRALRNLAASNTPVVNLFYTTYKARMVISSVAVPKTLAMFQENKELGQSYINIIKGWFYHHDIRKELQHMVRDAAEERSTQYAVLVVSTSRQDKIEVLQKATLIRNAELTPELLGNTIKFAQFKGRIMRVFELKLNPTRNEFNRYYHDELNYIKSFANHRYKTLTQEIANIKGMIQATNITDLVPELMLTKK